MASSFYVSVVSIHVLMAVLSIANAQHDHAFMEIMYDYVAGVKSEHFL